MDERPMSLDSMASMHAAYAEQVARTLSADLAERWAGLATESEKFRMALRRLRQDEKEAPTMDERASDTPSPAPVDHEGIRWVVEQARQLGKVLEGLDEQASWAKAELAGVKNKVEAGPRPRDEVIHRGLTGWFGVDVDAGVIRGKVVGILDTITFQGDTIPEAVRAFRDSVDAYLTSCDRRA